MTERVDKHVGSPIIHLETRVIRLEDVGALTGEQKRWLRIGYNAFVPKDDRAEAGWIDEGEIEVFGEALRGLWFLITSARQNGRMFREENGPLMVRLNKKTVAPYDEALFKLWQTAIGVIECCDLDYDPLMDQDPDLPDDSPCQYTYPGGVEAAKKVFGLTGIMLGEKA